MRQSLGPRLKHRPAPPDAVPVDELMHDTYLRFSRQQLLRHFAPVPGGGDPERHAAYYEQSLRRVEARTCRHAGGTGRCDPLAHQVEKDERFWVAQALLTAFHSTDPVAAFDRILRAAGVAAYRGPDQLGSQDGLRLYFEVNLPAPAAYLSALREDLPSRTYLPWLVEAASDGRRLEGSTKVDAVLLASTGFTVAFEAKVLSDVSTHTSFDIRRNQIARNLDVLLEPARPGALQARRPESSCFVLLTPQAFRDHPRSRLYGVLLEQYQDPARLQEDLPHRRPDELAGVPARLGWTTWERLGQIVPGATPWLARQD